MQASTLVVEPWNWHGDLGPKLWAVLSGFGWAAGTVATKYFQRGRKLDPLNFLAWQMLAGVIPITLLPFLLGSPAPQWSVTYALLLLYVGAVSTGLAFLLWVTILRFLPAGTASLNMFAIPVIALVSSMIVFGERLTSAEWLGIACIGAGLGSSDDQRVAGAPRRGARHGAARRRLAAATKGSVRRPSATAASSRGRPCR